MTVLITDLVRLNYWKPTLSRFGFFLFQGGLNVFLILPLLLACLNPAPGFHALEIAGVVVWVLGLAGESLADRQLAAFKRNPENRGKVCNTGLWRYSRHPNYFFEWTIWIGYALFALASPFGRLQYCGTRSCMRCLAGSCSAPCCWPSRTCCWHRCSSPRSIVSSKPHPPGGPDGSCRIVQVARRRTGRRRDHHDIVTMIRRLKAWWSDLAIRFMYPEVYGE